MSACVPSKKITAGIRPSGALRTTILPSRVRKAAAITAAGFCLGLFAAGPAHAQAAAEQHSSVIIAMATQTEAPPSMTPGSRRADFLGEPASTDARLVADWVVDTGDNRSLPFMIVDKKNTEVFVFDGHGHLLGATPALLGLARGDDSAPGIGDRKLSHIRPEERTTPAGRFVASLGHNLGPQDILWVDYAAAISLHRVLATNTREHRLERLAAASPLDHRITFGCINVPVKFYDSLVHTTFSQTNGIVYILPEIKSIPEVFFNSNS
jgi:hypothetical protein